MRTECRAHSAEREKTPTFGVNGRQIAWSVFSYHTTLLQLPRIFSLFTLTWFIFNPKHALDIPQLKCVKKLFIHFTDIESATTKLDTLLISFLVRSRFSRYEILHGTYGLPYPIEFWNEWKKNTFFFNILTAVLRNTTRLQYLSK